MLVDNIEIEKIQYNKLIFSIYKKDYLEIDEVLNFLSLETIPNDIQISNNKIFIRDITNYMIKNNLKPNII